MSVLRSLGSPHLYRQVLLRSLLAVIAGAGLAGVGWLPGWLVTVTLLAGWGAALHPMLPPSRSNQDALPSDRRWGGLLILIAVALAVEAARDATAATSGDPAWLLLFWCWTLLSTSGFLLLAGIPLLHWEGK